MEQVKQMEQIKQMEQVKRIEAGEAGEAIEADEATTSCVVVKLNKALRNFQFINCCIHQHQIKEDHESSDFQDVVGRTHYLFESQQ